MIGEDSDRVGGACEVLVPFSQGMYNGEEFSVIDVIIALGGGKRLREVSTGVEVTVQVLLHEYATGSSERGVSHDKEGFGVVGEGKDGLLKKRFLYFGESDFMDFCE